MDMEKGHFEHPDNYRDNAPTCTSTGVCTGRFLPRVLGMGLIFLIAYCQLSTADLFANSTTIDSLLQALHATQHDTTRIKTLNNLAWKLRYNNPDTAILLSTQALDIINDAERSEANEQITFFKKATAQSHHNLGELNRRKGNYSLALYHNFKALKIWKQLAKEQPSPAFAKAMAATIGNIGNVYVNQGDYPKSLEYYFKALKIDEEIDDKYGLAFDLGNIGNVNFRQGDYSKALEYYFKALKIDEELGNKDGISLWIGNIGTVYGIQGDYPKALEYFFKVLKMDEELGNKNGIARHLGNIGNIYADQGKANPNLSQRKGLINKALEYYFKSLKIEKKIGNKVGITITLGNIGVLYIEQEKYREAERYLLQALEIDTAIGRILGVMYRHESLSELYEQTGQYQKAYEHHIEYSIAKDSLFNEEKSKEIGKLEAGYDYEIKMQEQRLVQEKQLAVAASESKRQKVIIYAVSGGLLLVVMFLILLFNRFRIKQKANVLLAKKNRQITDSIDYAQRIQNAVLPPLDLVKTYFSDSFVLLKPKDIVSGDFFWLHQNNGKIMFAAADCTGHGVPGAFMSIIGNNILNDIATTNISIEPAEILNQLSKQLISRLKQKGKEGGVTDGMDIAFCSLETRQTDLPTCLPDRQAGQAGQSDQTEITLQYAGAHNPLYIISNGELKEIKGDRLFIGITGATSDSNFTNHNIQLKKGDCIYIFSDGYADQKGGPDSKMFDYPLFRQLLVEIHQKSMQEQKEILNKTMEDWKGDREQIDDMLIVGIRV